ncbi:MAG: DNA-binding GntR family transcriptional regulator [Verrucomicrobiales bacterium]|jgi:DNA-binding GntR family transcriptional regulator
MSTIDIAGTEPESLGEQAYMALRQKIVRLDFAPGDVLREDELQTTLGLGRTPIREALQRLQREHFVTVIPRRGMFVSGIEVSELSMLFETRAVLEPYAARLASLRGTTANWDEMEATLARTTEPGLDDEDQLALDRRCHEIIWAASGNRFLLDTLDMLYAQSDRLWHLYLADVADMQHAVDEHQAILAALQNGDGDAVAGLVETHVQSFDTQIRDAVTARLAAPLEQ